MQVHIAGMELVDEVLMEWERIVYTVAKVKVGEKMIVCGRAARLWDGQIRVRQEVYILEECLAFLASGSDPTCRVSIIYTTWPKSHAYHGVPRLEKS